MKRLLLVIAALVTAYVNAIDKKDIELMQDAQFFMSNAQKQFGACVENCNYAGQPNPCFNMCVQDFREKNKRYLLQKYLATCKGQEFQTEFDINADYKELGFFDYWHFKCIKYHQEKMDQYVGKLAKQTKKIKSK